MKSKRKNTIGFKLILWYTVLMSVLAIGLILCVVTVARMAENAEAQQNLVRSVERNIDEIEVENGLLDIESDFAYRNADVYSVVYNSAGTVIGGEYPVGFDEEPELEEERFDKFSGYYIYDTKVEFRKYDYKINGKTGVIISSEVEGADYYTPFEGSLDFYGDDCTVSCSQAFAIAVEKSGLDPSSIDIINAKCYEYNNEPIYEVEFYSSQKAFDDIWVRGIVKANGVDGVWAVLVRLAVLILPLLVLLCLLGGRVITKRALSPIRLLNDAVEEIHGGKDLTKRIVLTDGDPMIAGLAENFNEMFSRLQMSFESERQFSGDVSHELRTPTAVILAECEYQLARDVLDEEDVEGFENIRKQAESMKTLISQLLEMTRMEQNKDQILFECEDFSVLVHSVCDDSQSLDEKGIILHRDIDDGIFMNMDVLLMTRLVVNLMNNAYTYGKENGNITVSLKKDANNVRLTVSDDGVGIAEEHIDKIWNRVYRVDKARSREKGCSGLGLPMVRQIAELHGGSVSLKSEIGKGSTFIITF